MSLQAMEPRRLRLLWIAGFAALTTTAAVLTLGTDAATIAGALRRGWLTILGLRDATLTGETDQLIDALVTIAPAAAAIFATTTLTLNVWLAAKITATSGRLHRPWPDLNSAALPPMTLAALCAVVAFCFTGGLLAILALIVAAALMMAYALIGFAVLHTLTLALRSRAFWLGCTYTIMVVFVWPVIAMVILGLADALFGLRRRCPRRETCTSNSVLNLNHLTGDRIWKSFCWNVSPSSAKWGKSSASRTDLPAISS